MHSYPRILKLLMVFASSLGPRTAGRLDGKHNPINTFLPKFTYCRTILFWICLKNQCMTMGPKSSHKSIFTAPTDKQSHRSHEPLPVGKILLGMPWTRRVEKRLNASITNTDIEFSTHKHWNQATIRSTTPRLFPDIGGSISFATTSNSALKLLLVPVIDFSPDEGGSDAVVIGEGVGGPSSSSILGFF